MSLVTNTGWVAKNKDFQLVLSGFTGSGTSFFGSASDIECTDVEFFTMQKPKKSANETQEFESNLRGFKDSVGTKKWEDWEVGSLFSDSNGINQKAFIAAQECDATGTAEIKVRGSTTTLYKMQVKVKQAGGEGGDATAFDTAFSPTFEILQALALS